MTDAPPPTVKLSRLDGTTTPLAFTVAVDVKGASSAKLIVDGVYIGKIDQAPLAFDVRVTPGKHQLRVRSVVDGVERRSYAAFTASADPKPTAAPSLVPPLASRVPAAHVGSGTASATTPRSTSTPPRRFGRRWGRLVRVM